MLAFNALDLANRPANPTTARLCHVLAKLLQVYTLFGTLMLFALCWIGGPCLTRVFTLHGTQSLVQVHVLQMYLTDPSH